MTSQQNQSPAHTPGPWHYNSEVSLHGAHLVYGPDGRLVADAGRIHRRTDTEMKSNANLIAAAPDLLSAAEGAQRQISALLSFLKRNNQTDRVPWLGITEARNELEATIAQATGAA